MSAYVTSDQILGEIQLADLIALTDDTQTGQLNSTVLTQIIANASALIDAKVSNIYSTPFGSPIPSAVSNAALTIACYRLFRRREVPDEKNKFSEDYKAILEWLNQVNKGEAHIDQAPPRTFPQGAASVRPTLYGAGGYVLNSM